MKLSPKFLYVNIDVDPNAYLLNIPDVIYTELEEAFGDKDDDKKTVTLEFALDKMALS